MGSLFLSSPLLLFLCFHWMVFVFPEAEPLELLGGGMVRELWRRGMWTAYFYAFPVQDYHGLTRARLTLVPKTFTQLTEVASVARGGHR